MINPGFARVMCWIAGSSLCLMLIQNSKHSTEDYAWIAILCVLAAFAGETAHLRMSAASNGE